MGDYSIYRMDSGFKVNSEEEEVETSWISEGKLENRLREEQEGGWKCKTPESLCKCTLIKCLLTTCSCKIVMLG